MHQHVRGLGFRDRARELDVVRSTIRRSRTAAPAAKTSTRDLGILGVDGHAGWPLQPLARMEPRSPPRRGRESICSFVRNRLRARGLVDSPPMSKMSAPSAISKSTRARASCGVGKNAPPSENESGVTLQTPIRATPRFDTAPRRTDRNVSLRRPKSSPTPPELERVDITRSARAVLQCLATQIRQGQGFAASSLRLILQGLAKGRFSGAAWKYCRSIGEYVFAHHHAADTRSGERRSLASF